MVIKAYFVNDDILVKCDKKGIPITQDKLWKRDIPDKEVDFEKKFILNIDSENFIEKESRAYSWINFIFFNHQKPKHFEIYSIVKFFSLQMNIRLGREVYRRRRNCMFWLDKNIDKIWDICTKKKIVIMYNNDLIVLKPQNICTEKTVEEDNYVTKIDYGINDIHIDEEFINDYDSENINEYDMLNQFF